MEMRILVVGGTGHIGSHLVPRLVIGGHEVQVVTRNPRPQYADSRLLWPRVQWIVADRRTEEMDGTWFQRMSKIQTDAVIDLICYTPEQNETMYRAFRGRIAHFIHCGTIWSYGPSEKVPYEEHFPRKPIDTYGINKAMIEAFLLSKYREEGFPATVIHPGHISARRWLPIDPQGSRNGVEIYKRLATEQEVHLPDRGLATLQHVHADDVAQLFQLASERRQTTLGESFSAVAPYAMTLVSCCNAVAGFFCKRPNLRFVALEKLNQIVGESSFEIILDHVRHSPCVSIEKSRRMLGYSPRYTTEQIYLECIEYMMEQGQLHI